MQKKWTLLMMAFLFFHSYQSFGQEEFKPSGAPYARIFFNVHSDFTGKPAAFEIKRAYFGYKYKMSEQFSGDIVLDVGPAHVRVNDTATEKTSLHLTAYLKIAALTYKNGNFEIDLGMISLRQFKVHEQYWGYRYIEESFQDLYDLGPSSDLGFSVEYKFHSMFTADLTVRNGEGYKSMQSDNSFNTGLGLSFAPVEGLIIRGFYDYLKKEVPQGTIAHFIGYQNNKISAGVEHNTQLNHKNKKDQNLNGYSAYTSYSISEKIKIFGRYDGLFSNDMPGNGLTWNYSNNGKFIISGVEYSPLENVQLALNYQGWLPDDKSIGTSNSIYLNFQYEF